MDLKLQAEQVVAPNLWLSKEVSSNRAHSQQGPAPPRAPPFKTSQLECFRFVETVIFRKM